MPDRAVTATAARPIRYLKPLSGVFAEAFDAV
jgi:hypothetical protein